MGNIMNKIDKFDGKYSFLSNFYKCHIMYEGLHFSSTEAAFQAMKTLNDIERHKFENLSPSDAKKLGRHITLRPDWESVKDQIMLDILRIKFSDPDLKEKLLSTGDSELIEGTTWHDNYWGNCSCSKCKDKIGNNMLGKLLMQVREECR